MSFDVAADAYGRFMGLFSEPLAAEFAALVGVEVGQRVLDVGCGPGALSAVLARRVGPGSVSAVDPSTSFVAALRDRLPEVDVRPAAAEALPFPDESFDLTLAQLVVHFMDDPETGIAEMARVTRPGGGVAACVWDHAGGTAPLSVFWRAVHDLDPGARDESALAGARDGHLAELFGRAGLASAEQSTLTVRASFADFDAWWEPYTLGVGVAGDYVAAMDPEHRDRLMARCRELLPDGRFVVEATAWAVVAHR